MKQRRPATMIPFDRQPPPTLDEVELLTVQEAAQLLKVSRSTMYDLLARGALPCVAVSAGIKRITKTALRDYIARQTQGGH